MPIDSGFIFFLYRKYTEDYGTHPLHRYDTRRQNVQHRYGNQLVVHVPLPPKRSQRRRLLHRRLAQKGHEALTRAICVLKCVSLELLVQLKHSVVIVRLRWRQFLTERVLSSIHTLHGNQLSILKSQLALQKALKVT